MILYKDESMAYDLSLAVDWRLIPLLALTEEEARKRSCGVRVSGVLRDDGVHQYRAFDCGFFTLRTYIRNYDVGLAIEEAVNEKVEYGIGHDGKLHPAALWHDAGSGLHLHVQVPDHELILRQ